MAVKISSPIKAFSVKTGNEEEKKPAAAALRDNDPDRRMAFDDVPVPPEASLRFVARPKDPAGHQAQVFMVDSPEGAFAMAVTRVPNTLPNCGYPFEVWTMGDSVPAGLGALCKSLSLDMRSEDRAWLKRKLEALMGTEGTPFEYVTPDGVERTARGAVAAFATILFQHCEELGCFTEAKLAQTPIIDALMSKREPKASDDGALAWNAPVENPGTQEKFEVFLKEAELPDGTRRPYSLWFSGRFSQALVGLQKSLSIDMRVVEPGWIGRKLRQLVDFHDRGGEFHAKIPGSEKGKLYPSTVAYVADLLLNRFSRLGILTREGYPINESGVIQLDMLRAAKTAEPRPIGRDCSNCGAKGTVVRLDGCDTCTECAASKCG